MTNHNEGGDHYYGMTPSLPPYKSRKSAFYVIDFNCVLSHLLPIANSHPVPAFVATCQWSYHGDRLRVPQKVHCRIFECEIAEISEEKVARHPRGAHVEQWPLGFPWHIPNFPSFSQFKIYSILLDPFGPLSAIISQALLAVLRSEFEESLLKPAGNAAQWMCRYEADAGQS
ncbi:hypothetical protein VFPPC_17609 [Pochonia chlamydosporia 170]|uniref:Uncharacterized protein n=1 Tax=Pochonia chlamydosporia 170 TaxID=1380566 RepID=A0A219AR19_METCM|nr:hypothetical protein VFPPC_17609 [Pochonia chlamydosporia 170]OWT43228.1 hypothetical protein VFPPC_17609 [Pochonia chlamydosporia 170]